MMKRKIYLAGMALTALSALVVMIFLIRIPVYAIRASDAIEWAKSQVGKQIGNGQCTRLSEAYAMKFFGLKLTTTPKEYPYADVPDGWEKIEYHPGFIPSPGDIAIWTPGRGPWGWIGDNGHTAIILSATEHELVSVDQNWDADGKGSAAQIVTHPYNSFWGVLRPPVVYPVLQLDG